MHVSFAIAPVALLVSAVAAEAQSDTLLKQADPEIVLEVAKGYGSATLDKDEQGDPMISGRLQGMKYVIYFYDCAEAKNCRSIQFSAGYTDSFDAKRANEWNTQYRWIRAFPARRTRPSRWMSISTAASPGSIWMPSSRLETRSQPASRSSSRRSKPHCFVPFRSLHRGLTSPMETGAS